MKVLLLIVSKHKGIVEHTDYDPALYNAVSRIFSRTFTIAFTELGG